MTPQVKIGDRIKLISIDDPFTILKPGDVGTVWDITTTEMLNEEIRQIWIHWDTGSRLALIEGEDQFEILS
jgi:hypothetical protein